MEIEPSSSSASSLCLRISMDECTCFVSWNGIAGLGPQPKVCSWCRSCANFLILGSLSSPPPLPAGAGAAALLLSTRPKVEIKPFGAAVCESLRLTSAGDWDWIKIPTFSQTFGCVCEVGHTWKVAQSICVPRISHLTMWTKRSRIGVCPSSGISPLH